LHKIRRVPDKTRRFSPTPTLSWCALAARMPIPGSPPKACCPCR